LRASRRTATGEIVLMALLRDAMLRTAPQDEVRGNRSARASRTRSCSTAAGPTRRGTPWVGPSYFNQPRQSIVPLGCIKNHALRMRITVLQAGILRRGARNHWNSLRKERPDRPRPLTLHRGRGCADRWGAGGLYLRPALGINGQSRIWFGGRA
jgi:hypothetical protein